MSQLRRVAKGLLHNIMVVIGGALLTGSFFLVLPLIQAIGEKPEKYEVTDMPTADLPPPPPPPEEPEPEKEQEQEPPPELDNQPQQLDLSQLELAMNPGMGGGFMGGDFGLKLDRLTSVGEESDQLFSADALGQKPRATYQAPPIITAKMRKKTPGKVYLLVVVDENGRVASAKVQSSSHPIFEKASLTAMKKWKFEPGKRNGKPVRTRIRQPFNYPKR